jgi:hypothetical protein
MLIGREWSPGNAFDVAINPLELSHPDNDPIDVSLKQREPQHQVRHDRAQSLASLYPRADAAAIILSICHRAQMGKWRAFHPDILQAAKMGAASSVVMLNGWIANRNGLSCRNCSMVPGS